MSPIVSVIIPVYNQESHLGTCLDSILEQDFTDFEILLVNDASTDFTPQVCEMYAKKDKRIKIFTNEKNRGQGYSRNFALKQARGKYITFVDSDDYIQTPLLIEGVQILDIHEKYDIVYFNTKEFSVTNEFIGEKSFIEGEKSGSDVFFDTCTNKIHAWGPCAKLYRINLLLDNNIYFPEYLFEDNLFSLKVYYYARYVYFTDLYGYSRIYTQHEASAMTPVRVTPKHISSLCNLAYDIEHFLNSIKTELYQRYEECIDIVSKRLYKNFKNHLLRLSIYSKYKIIPLNERDLNFLLNSQYFLKYFLHDYINISIYTKYKEKSFYDQEAKILLKKLQHNISLFKILLKEYLDMIFQKEFYNYFDKKTKKTSLENIIRIQSHIFHTFIENSYTLRIGQTLLKRSYIEIIKQLFNEWQLLHNIKTPVAFGGNSFSILINTYKQKGFDATLDFLHNTTKSPIIRANAYTAIAKNIQNFDRIKCAELARMAYEIDPQFFRLKWMSFMYYNAGDKVTAFAALNMLPSNIKMNSAEKRKSMLINNELL